MRALAVLFGLAAWLAGAAAVHANVIVVEANFVVPGGNSPSCELDEAIQAANDNQYVGGCQKGDPGADVIQFDIQGSTIDVSQELPAIDEQLTIQGPGADLLTIDLQQTSRVFAVSPGVAFTLEGVTLARGAAGAGNGGGLQVQAGADVVLRDCRITGSTGQNGGGIDVDQATVRVERCLLDGDEATAAGGALRNAGGTVELVNTTVSGNLADQGSGIAAVDAGGAGTTSLHNVTFAENGGSESVFVSGSSDVLAGHTLFAGPNCNGPITSLDYNLANDLSCGLDGLHDVEGAAAGVAALADNGGPTPTHALQVGSPAIDGGNLQCRDGEGAVLATDQRGPGFPRPADGDGLPGWRCDIGAFEKAPEPGAGAAAAATAASLAALARRRPRRVRSSAHCAP